MKAKQLNVKARTSSINFEVIESSKPVLGSRDCPQVMRGDLHVACGIIRPTERSNSPIGVKPWIRDFAQDDRRHVYAAVAASYLGEDGLFKLLPRKQRLRHLGIPSKARSNHYKRNLAVVQADISHLLASHGFNKGSVGEEITGGLLTGRKVGGQGACNTSIAVGYVERDALIGGRWRFSARLNRNHSGFQNARAKTARRIRAPETARTLVCSLYVGCRHDRSGIRNQIELVVHLVADRDGGATNHVDLCGTRVKGEIPLTVLVERQCQAGHAAATRSRVHALQADGFKFLGCLSGAMHSSLLVPDDFRSVSISRQGRAA